MKNIRNKNQPVNADLVQVYLQSSWDKVTAIYARLADLETIAAAIDAGTLDQYLSESDIDTLAELNAILTDATLVDAASIPSIAQSNFAAGADPTVTDDDSSGYEVGSLWINASATPKRYFVCANAATGSAEWLFLSLSNSDDLTEGATNLLMTTAERAKLGVLQSIKDNWAAVAAPGPAADSGAGYSVGSRWFDTANQDLYFCVDNTLGAAVWQSIPFPVDFGDAAWSSDWVTANRAPTVTDDSDSEYSSSSLWVDTTNDKIYMCVDATVGAAIWLELSPERLNKFDGTAAPTANDDSGDGYSPGSMWVDVTNDVLYFCLDATAAAAVWQEVGAGGGGGLAWTTYSTNQNVVKDTGSIFRGLAGDVTATLPASPAVGDTLAVFNNDNDPLLYDVIVTAGGTNQIQEMNLSYTPQLSFARGEGGMFICHDAGATKRWHLIRYGVSGGGGSGGGLTPVFKTTAYTASDNESVYCKTLTAGAAFTVTLPAAPTTNSIVVVADCEDSAHLYPVTIDGNGNTINNTDANTIELNIAGGQVSCIWNDTASAWEWTYMTPGASGFSGKRSFWIGIEECRDGSTQVPAALTEKWQSTNSTVPVRAFDPASVELVLKNVAVPKSWDVTRGISFTPYWMPATTHTGDVKWEVRVRDGVDGLDISGGHVASGCFSVDTAQGTADVLHIGPESNIIFADKITKGALLNLRIQRLASDAADTFTGDAYLAGIMVHYFTDAPTDD